MNTAQEFTRLYNDVACNIEKTLIDIEKINVESEEGKLHLAEMTSHFKSLQETFNSKLSFLEQHAEWDKFTLAFFGETNAGKSTIIESLRILFNEESREKFIERNKGDLETAEKELSDALDCFYIALTDIYTELSEKISRICTSSKAIKKVADSESAMRLKLESEETNARLQQERHESNTRMQILQEQISKKNLLKLLITSVTSFALGASLMAVIPLATG